MTSETTSKSSSVWKKALAFNSKPTESTFPELPVVLKWMRVGLGILYGIYLGATGISKSIGLVFGINMTMFVPIIYCQFYLGLLDFDVAYPNSNVRFAGLVQGMAWLLLVWITLYTLHHADEHDELTTRLLQQKEETVSETTTMERDSIMTETDTMTAPVEDVDSEF